MNKKIASEIAVGVILILAIVIGGLFWLQGKQSVTSNQKQEMQKPATEEKTDNSEKVVYLEIHAATKSPYERGKTNYPNDQYTEIYAMNPEAKNKSLLYSDKDEDFYIESNYYPVKILRNNRILFTAEKRIYDSSKGDELSYNILNLSNKELIALPNLPIPDNFVAFRGTINELPDGRFVYVGGSEKENVIFVCDKDFSNVAKIYSTPIDGAEGINEIAVSRDGQKIAFSTGLNGVGGGKYLKENTFVINIDGSNLRKIFKKDTMGSVIEWLPDGERFIFVSGVPNDSSAKLSLVSLTGEIEPLIVDGTYPKISSNGNEILSLKYIYDGKGAFLGSYKLYVSNLNGSRTEEIVSTENNRNTSLDNIGWIIN